MSAAEARRRLVLSLGSNLGDRLGSLQRGIDLLCGGQVDDPPVSAPDVSGDQVAGASKQGRPKHEGRCPPSH